MQIPRNKRSWAAIGLLLLMVANFALEGSLLYQVYGKPLLTIQSASLFSGSSTCSGTEASSDEELCCSVKSKPAACGCPCCGDTCPMGDACACLTDGNNAVQPEGLFFRMPGCHPAQNTGIGAYLPLSVRLVYLPPQVPSVAGIPDGLPAIFETPISPAGSMPAPPVPPPEPLAA